MRYWNIRGECDAGIYNVEGSLTLFIPHVTLYRRAVAFAVNEEAFQRAQKAGVTQVEIELKDRPVRFRAPMLKLEKAPVLCLHRTVPSRYLPFNEWEQVVPKEAQIAA